MVEKLVEIAAHSRSGVILIEISARRLLRYIQGDVRTVCRTKWGGQNPPRPHTFHSLLPVVDFFGIKDAAGFLLFFPVDVKRLKSKDVTKLKIKKVRVAALGYSLRRLFVARSLLGVRLRNSLGAGAGMIGGLVVRLMSPDISVRFPTPAPNRAIDRGLCSTRKLHRAVSYPNPSAV